MPDHEATGNGNFFSRYCMKKLICLILIASITACATCKSTDSYEVCRSKQRDHSQPKP
jgi:hypothetical protein